jgi:hypothetical protein
VSFGTKDNFIGFDEAKHFHDVIEIRDKTISQKGKYKS